MSFTVSAAVPSLNKAAALKVYVVTGAAESGGNNAGVFANFGVPAASLTPAQSGSLIVLGLDGDAAFTAEPNNTYDNTGTPATSENYAAGHYTGTVTAGTAVTVGSSASVSGTACLAAYELVPSGSPAIDGSTPTAATATSSPVTSAAFTPPAGAVLAAVVPYDSTATNPTITVSDTSGLGLTWTKRVQFDGGGFSHGAAIYTATVPGAAAAPARGNTRPGKTWQRRFRHPQFLPLPPAPPPPVVTVNAGVATVAAAAPQVSFGTYITGLAGTPGPGYFTDNHGNPRLWVATETWGLPVNAGNYSSPSYQHDYDTFFSARAAQGFTVVMTDPMWAETGQATQYNGNTWDSVTPLAGGSTDPSTAALNSTFWTRIDYMLTSAASNGITIGFVIYDGSDPGNSSDLTHSWTTTQWQAWANKVGSRYASTANLVWLVGNDAFSPFSDSIWTAIQAGLSAAGDTHLISAWYNAETTSRYVSDTSTSETWGAANANFNFCYTYNAGYWIMEYAYLEVANEGAANLLPNIWGDGYFYTGTSGSGYFAGDDRAMRQEWWWQLASGARGILGEAENVYPWASGSAAAVTGNWFFANNAANIVTTFTSLTGWHLLIPDTGNALVTAGRGTRVSGLASGGSGGAYESAFTNSYVAASRTPDSGSGSSLAVLYLPNHTTITIDQTKMASGYTATWVDPISGAPSSATTGSTYNSTAKGTNSQGDPDWALILQAPSGVSATAGVAAVTAVASAASVAETVTAGAGTVLTVAPAASAAETVTAGIPTVLGAVSAASTAETVTAGVGVVVAADPGATVSTSSSTTATAGVAVVLAVASAATAAEGAIAGASTVLAAATQASIAETIIAGVGVINTVATQATVNTSGNTNANAAVAAVSTLAVAPTTAVTFTAGAATAQALVSAPVAAPAAFASVGTVLAAAPGATVATLGGTVANAAAAVVAAVARAPGVSVAAVAQAAVVLTLAPQVPPPFIPGFLTATSVPLATLTANDQRAGGPS